MINILRKSPELLPDNIDKHTVKVIILPTSIMLDRNSITLEKGKTQTISTTILPTNATEKNITWSSTNKNIVTVSNGKITAVGPGTASINVSTVNGKNTKCTVKVIVKPTSVKINKTSLTLERGESYTLGTTLYPNDTTEKNLTWTSSDTNILSVSNGKVTAKTAGKATVTVKTSNGKTATCKVRVYVVNYKKAYTADQVYSDINYLQKSYPDIIKVSSIGKSVKNRDIKLIQLGKGNKKGSYSWWYSCKRAYHRFLYNALHRGVCVFI